MTMRSASPLGAPRLLKLYSAVIIAALALAYADPAYAKKSNDQGGDTAANTQSDGASTDGETSGKNSKKAKKRTTDAGGDGNDNDNDNDNDTPSNDNDAPSNDNDTASNDTPSGDNDTVLTTPPAHDADDDNAGSGGSDGGTSLFSPRPRASQAKAKMLRAQKELARLFNLSPAEVQAQFPDGGFDEALVQAANQAKRAERRYKRRRG